MALKVGIIGGTGFDDPEIIANREELIIDTPFGATSAPLISGEISGVPCVLVLRHGSRHQISPTHVPFRANMHAMRSVGCTHVLATTACGSLREEIVPGEVLVVLDQFIDRTTKRHSTFYDGTQPDTYRGELECVHNSANGIARFSRCLPCAHGGAILPPHATHPLASLRAAGTQTPQEWHGGHDRRPEVLNQSRICSIPELEL